MKKSKIFFGVSTLVLACSAVFAFKTNKKFAAVATLYYLRGSTHVLMANGGSTVNIFTTTSPGVAGHTAFFGDITTGLVYTMYAPVTGGGFAVLYNKVF